MAISPSTRMPAKISRQTWAPCDDSFLISTWTGSGTRLTSARPCPGKARITLLLSAVSLTRARESGALGWLPVSLRSTLARTHRRPSAQARSANARVWIRNAWIVLPPSVVGLTSAPGIGSFIRRRPRHDQAQDAPIVAHRAIPGTGKQRADRRRFRTQSDALVCSWPCIGIPQVSPRTPSAPFARRPTQRIKGQLHKRW
jgi:hypothetical protein